MWLRSLLGARNSKRRVVSGVAIGMAGFIVVGIFYHDVIRQTIAGALTFSILFVVLPIFAKKDEEKD
jgi:hypothetical protein